MNVPAAPWRPYRMAVGTFVRAIVIADDREAALKNARAGAKEHGFKVLDVAQVHPQSPDEWLVEFMVKEE